MTILASSRSLPTTAPEPRLRAVLLWDAAVTGAVGVGIVLAATPLAAALPGSTTLMRALGIALFLVAADIGFVSRGSGRRLVLAGTVVAELALAWAVLSTVVVAVVRPEASVALATLAVAAITLAFGVTELRLVRASRGAASGR